MIYVKYTDVVLRQHFFLFVRIGEEGSRQGEQPKIRVTMFITPPRLLTQIVNTPNWRRVIWRKENIQSYESQMYRSTDSVILE